MFKIHIKTTDGDYGTEWFQFDKTVRYVIVPLHGKKCIQCLVVHGNGLYSGYFDYTIVDDCVMAEFNQTGIDVYVPLIIKD